MMGDLRLEIIGMFVIYLQILNRYSFAAAHREEYGKSKSRLDIRFARLILRHAIIGRGAKVKLTRWRWYCICLRSASTVQSVNG